MNRFAPMVLVVLVGCGGSDAPGKTFFEREIAPILQGNCSSAGGNQCHVNDGLGRAHGNLDLSSYDGLLARPDVLKTFGSYPYPLLLMKAVAGAPESQVTVTIGDVEDVHLNITHAGGALFETNDERFFTLQKWLADGATENGLPAVREPLGDLGACTPDIRVDLFAQPTLDAVDIESEGYKRFYDEVWPIIVGGIHNGDDLGVGCLGRQCHGMRDTNGVPTNELYFTCGDNEQQQRFNYLMARTYTGADGRGQITQKPLIGGAFHAGVTPFLSVNDPRYQAMHDWAAMDPPFQLQSSEGEAFFSHNVQPALFARGCYLEACHSLVNFNFYKPLAGTDGYFGTRVSLHNYLQARFMLGLESRDPYEGRLLKKNILEPHGGIQHRGGPLLGGRQECTLDVAAVRANPTRRWFEEVTPGCIVHAWHRLEREVAVEVGQLGPTPGQVAVFVRRPSNPDRLIDFATYRPGADLLRVDLATDAGGRVTGTAGAPTSLLTNCGVGAGAADVRRPDISGDGSRVVFAMRTSAAEGLDLWQVNTDGSNCQRLGLPGGTDAAGAPIHHFDPVFAPGGLFLFASTQADAAHPDPDRRYASRTPKFFLPNSNIWVFAPGGTPQKMSYLNGAQLTPHVLHTREVTYALEKAAPDFYQIATRAIRLDDGGGYRPQNGQRPKMGFGQVTEMRELVDFKTVFIASDPGTHFAGGTLMVQDLSLGLEELEYQDVAFLHPNTVLDPAAASSPGAMGTGAYRSPTPLPDGRILVAYSPAMVDLGNQGANVDYGLWVVDPEGREAPFMLLDAPGEFDIEPAVAYRRIFVPQPNRFHHGDPLRGEYVFHSVPMFGPLLNDNTRVLTVPTDNVASIRVLEQMPPPDGVTSPAEVSGDLHGPEQVYMKRRLIGEVPLLEDGSVRILVPSRTPIVMELLDADGNVLDWQREEEQIGPGETQPRLTHMSLFNAVCGGCHNALDGTELGVSVGPDVTTGASTRSEASKKTTEEAVNLFQDPSSRAEVPFTL